MYAGDARRDLAAAGVDVRLGTEATAADADGRDLVVARHRRAAVPPAAAPRLPLPRRAGAGRRSPTRRRSRGPVLVADWGGGYEGLDAAELLAARGLRRRARVRRRGAGEGVHQYQRNLYLARLDEAGVRIRHHLELAAPMAPRCATCSPAARSRSARSRRSSWPRAACPTTRCGRRSRAGRACVRAGDVLGPRSAEEAMLEGVWR